MEGRRENTVFAGTERSDAINEAIATELKQARRFLTPLGLAAAPLLAASAGCVSLHTGLLTVTTDTVATVMDAATWEEKMTL